MLLTRVFHTPINAVPVASNFRYLFFLPKMPSCFPNIHFLHPFLLFCLSYFLFILTEKLLLRSMESKFQIFFFLDSSLSFSKISICFDKYICIFIGIAGEDIISIRCFDFLLIMFHKVVSNFTSLVSMSVLYVTYF